MKSRLKEKQNLDSNIASINWFSISKMQEFIWSRPLSSSCTPSSLLLSHFDFDFDRWPPPSYAAGIAIIDLTINDPNHIAIIVPTFLLPSFFQACRISNFWKEAIFLDLSHHRLIPTFCVWTQVSSFCNHRNYKWQTMTPWLLLFNLRSTGWDVTSPIPHSKIKGWQLSMFACHRLWHSLFEA